VNLYKLGCQKQLKAKEAVVLKLVYHPHPPTQAARRQEKHSSLLMIIKLQITGQGNCFVSAYKNE
jgi:hypothetical protein